MTEPSVIQKPWWCATCESWRHTMPCGRDECPVPQDERPPCCEGKVVDYVCPCCCHASQPSPAPPPDQGHIDPDCEIVRGVGWMCTCETPEEKARNETERAECEAERDAQSLPAPPPVGEEPSVTTDPWKAVRVNYGRLVSYIKHSPGCEITRTEFCTCGLSELRFGAQLDAAIATERKQHAEQIASLRAEVEKERKSACDWMVSADREEDKREASESREASMRAELDGVKQFMLAFNEEGVTILESVKALRQEIETLKQEKANGHS